MSLYKYVIRIIMFQSVTDCNIFSDTNSLEGPGAIFNLCRPIHHYDK